jgi:phosphomannomutase/phosphoglucomutase
MRLDQWMTEQGFAESDKEASKLIQLGRVKDSRSGQALDKPGMKVPKNLSINIEKPDPFVSRAGHKLNEFLEAANIDLSGSIALDVGSSTGGFTDCLLQRGVREVFAVDVGTHQLHEKLRADKRVHIFEQTDIRDFNIASLPTQPDLVVVDVSFISLRAVVPTLVKALPSARFIFLFKPQFEVGRYVPKKRGVAPQEESKKSLEEMLLFLESLGLNPIMVKASSLKGSKGNQESLIMAETIEVPQHIFRTYDIRGVADQDLKSETVTKIGFSIGRRVLEKCGAGARVGVGRDERVSSPRVFQALINGLKAHDLKVVDLGSITTPMSYFAHYVFNLDGTIQVTASHNPKDDNGFKMMIAKETLFGEEIESIGKEVAGLENMNVEDVKADEDIQSDLRQKYIEYMHAQFKFKKKYKVVADCANGMAGGFARDVLTPYVDELHMMYEEVDCSFPNHPADPTVPENLVELQKTVVEKSADIGFSYDGDGDRVGVITAKGRVLWGDEILMLLSELVLKQKPGSTIIGEVKCSEKLFQMISDKGGKPLMYRTGHSLIKKKMKELGAPIAGEMSGHLFFADRYFGFDDALYGTLRVIEVVDQLGLDLDEWIERYPKSFVTPELRVNCEESEKAGLVEKVKAFFKDQKGAKLHLIDGVRVSFEDGSWALVRSSNTQAVLVVRVEAGSEERLSELKAIVSKALGRPLP